MHFEGNLRKMNGELGEDGKVRYYLNLPDILETRHNVFMNDLIGKRITISYKGHINSVLSGAKMKKAYGEGLTYKEFMESPLASPSIVRPELSRIHEGIALRDLDWEMEHHMKPHYVYISLTSGYKVGVTRDVNVPFRWIDQGATKAVKIAQVPYRQLAGLIEVSLKPHIADKTNWQAMLKGVLDTTQSIEEVREWLLKLIPSEYAEYVISDDKVCNIEYPVLRYPEKVKSLKLDRDFRIKRNLVGIKGQYLIFDTGDVLNIRSHAGYRIDLSVDEPESESVQTSLF